MTILERIKADLLYMKEKELLSTLDYVNVVRLIEKCEHDHDIDNKNKFKTGVTNFFTFMGVISTLIIIYSISSL